MISKKENDQHYVQYTLIVKHIFMTTIGNVMGHSIENTHADVRFSSD